MATKLQERRKLLVWGYIRNIVTAYKSLNVPLDIYNVMYLFSRLNDIWSKEYSHKDLIIDQDGTYLKFVADSTQTAFGTNVVKKGIFSWKLQIISKKEINNVYGPCIGIVEDDELLNEDTLRDYQSDDEWCQIGCQLEAGISKLQYPWLTFDETESKEKTWNYVKANHALYNDCIWNKPNDILEIVLNLDERTLRFILNDKDYGIAYREIKQASYRLALTVEGAIGAEFALL